MKEYFHLNKHKFPFALGMIWLVFFILSLVPVFASNGRSTAVELIQNLVLCLLVTGILAVLMAGLSFLSAFSDFQSRAKKFGTEPWQSVFQRFGFEPHLVRVKDRYQFVQQVMLGKIHSFPVLVMLEKGRKQAFVFRFIVERRTIEPERFVNLQKLFSEYRGAFDRGSINLKLPANTTAIAPTIERELIDFGEVLTREGFNPGRMEVRNGNQEP